MSFGSFYFDDDIVQDPTSIFNKSPRTLYEEYKRATAAGREGSQTDANTGGSLTASAGGNAEKASDRREAQSAASGTAGSIPTVASDNHLYRSSVLMLRKTKAEVEEFAKDLGAASAIADLPVSSDVRRTVARIFADPRNADAISDAEWRRRELEYRMSKELLDDKINEHLGRERDLLQNELSSLPKPK